MKKELQTGQIEFINIAKSYRTSKGKYGLLRDIIGEKFSGLSSAKSKNQEKFYALRNISFTVNPGECLGIIGNNGAGKSTILKLISKITYPEKGLVKARGRIGAFIELGAGLHHELTGKENIYLYGAILGMSKAEIKKQYRDIVRFAGIGKFLDVPIKKYSSGMYSRLGFSVCAFSDPDILLVDEVLAVGDIDFQKRCLEKMHSFAGRKTIVFVSHNLDAIKSICSRVIFIDGGEIVKIGRPNDVIKEYVRRSSKSRKN
ncbi:ABC transporter ATP-binding protein [Candidatus Curtissbacteria bacterium]|nr:ABC transporter ATP-binding protein [Candidatus Curtissbacteria bacterium]